MEGAHRTPLKSGSAGESRDAAPTADLLGRHRQRGHRARGLGAVGSPHRGCSGERDLYEGPVESYLLRVLRRDCASEVFPEGFPDDEPSYERTPWIQPRLPSAWPGGGALMRPHVEGSVE
jgi:hypothetical protein